MSRLLASALVVVGLAFELCGGFSAISSAQEKPVKQNAESPYERIMAALDGPTEFDFIETPLKDVIEAVKIRHGIQLQLDVRAITDAGTTADAPITCTLKGISLRSALRLMLREHELDFLLSDECLVITHADSRALREYDVSDLLPEGATIEELTSAISFAMPRVAAAKSDGSVGGVGGAAPVAPPAGFGGGSVSEDASADGQIVAYGAILMVRTSDRGHMNVTNLLEELRHRMKGQHRPQPQAASQDHPQTSPPTGRGARSVSVVAPNQ
jgi:hypothetical protein